MRRFDVVEGGGQPFVVIESDLLPPDSAVVLIPLVGDYPSLIRLNPQIAFDGQNYILATRLIAPVPRNRLRRIGSVSDQADTITRAVDMLMSGY